MLGFYEVMPLHKLTAGTDWVYDIATAANKDGVIGAVGFLAPKDAPASGKRAVLLIPAEIVPDWNRDGSIDERDTGRASQESPWRWWINDDWDRGDIANDDTPFGESDGRSNSYSGNQNVDGLSDLLDFFVLKFDIRTLLQIFPPEISEYRILQEDSAVNFVYTDLEKANAGDYLRNVIKAQSLKVADCQPVSDSGRRYAVLNTEWLKSISTNPNRGILIMEASRTTVKPLRMEVWRGNAKLSQVGLPLSFSGVEAMFRWINLRGLTGQTEDRPTNISPPRNYPDDQTNGKVFIFVHGYNVSEYQSRAWGSEIFKRMFQSASNAKFAMVSWHGDYSQILTPVGRIAPDYWQNVINAFDTAPYLAVAVSKLTATTKVIAAHSLGNIIVSAAITDDRLHLNVDKYFMLDAAVPQEAYDPSMVNATVIDEMQPNVWNRYVDETATPERKRRVFATDWHLLFAEDDGRRALTWRARFGQIPGAVNYYSPTEDVLNNNLAGGITPDLGTERAWVAQEMMKGTNDFGATITFQSNGGWGFNTTVPLGWNVPTGPPPLFLAPMTEPADVWRIPDDALRTKSYFAVFSNPALYGDGGSSVGADRFVRAKVLAEAIPATSRASGRNAIFNFADENRNLMELRDSWPASRADRWLHSDAKDVAYTYNHRLFENWVSLGGLDND